MQPRSPLKSLSLSLRTIRLFANRLVATTLAVRKLSLSITSISDTLYAQQIIASNYAPTLTPDELTSHLSSPSKLLTWLATVEQARRDRLAQDEADSVMVTRATEAEEEEQEADMLRKPWRDVRMEDKAQAPNKDPDTGKVIHDSAWRRYVRGEED